MCDKRLRKLLYGLVHHSYVTYPFVFLRVRKPMRLFQLQHKEVTIFLSIANRGLGLTPLSIYF